MVSARVDDRGKKGGVLGDVKKARLTHSILGRRLNQLLEAGGSLREEGTNLG